MKSESSLIVNSHLCMHLLFNFKPQTFYACTYVTLITFFTFKQYIFPCIYFLNKLCVHLLIYLSLHLKKNNNNNLCMQFLFLALFLLKNFFNVTISLKAQLQSFFLR